MYHLNYEPSSARRKKLLPRIVYLRVSCIATVMGFIGTEVVSRFVYHVLHGFEIPLSILTWILLVHFLDWRATPVAVIKNALIGALSPIIGCLVGIIYGGLGLFFLLYVLPSYHVFAPFGIATALIIHVTERRKIPDAQISSPQRHDSMRSSEENDKNSQLQHTD